MASGGYPESYEKGKEITGLAAAEEDKDVVVFHAGTKEAEGKIVTSGGRVLGVTAVDSSIKAARDRAYAAVEKIAFEKNFYRKDIAWRAKNKMNLFNFILPRRSLSWAKAKVVQAERKTK